VSAATPPQTTDPLLPDPEQVRARLADLAVEQARLRAVLRALVRAPRRLPAREAVAQRKGASRA
jgi:hypothetical protein